LILWWVESGFVRCWEGPQLKERDGDSMHDVVAIYTPGAEEILEEGLCLVVNYTRRRIRRAKRNRNVLSDSKVILDRSLLYLLKSGKIRRQQPAVAEAHNVLLEALSLECILMSTMHHLKRYPTDILRISYGAGTRTDFWHWSYDGSRVGLYVVEKVHNLKKEKIYWTLIVIFFGLSQLMARPILAGSKNHSIQLVGRKIANTTLTIRESWCQLRAWHLDLNKSLGVVGWMAPSKLENRTGRPSRREAWKLKSNLRGKWQSLMVVDTPAIYDSLARPTAMIHHTWNRRSSRESEAPRKV